MVHRKVSCGDFQNSSAAIKNDNSLVALPTTYTNYQWQSSKPSGTNILEVACGHTHGVVLRENGTVESWGYDYVGAVSGNPAGTDFISVGAGRGVNAAVKANGTLISWGGTAFASPPDTDIISVSCGKDVVYALKEGNVFKNVVGSYGLPTNITYKRVSAGNNKGVGIKADGSLVGNNIGTVPAGNDFIDVDCYSFGVAIKEDGSLVGWNGNPTLPTKKGFVQVSVGENTVIALNEDGTIWSNITAGIPTTNDFYVWLNKYLIKNETTGDIYTWNGTSWTNLGAQTITTSFFSQNGFDKATNLNGANWVLLKNAGVENIKLLNYRGTGG
jgi:alpha-tubulin suppressor-like RCC1 family protein